MAVDAEKALDWLEWACLYKRMKVYNFLMKCINMVKIIYKLPKAQIYTDGTLSEPFPLSSYYLPILRYIYIT